MKTLSRDTNEDVQQMHFNLIRQVAASKRLALAGELTAALREWTIANIRFSFPNATSEEIRRKFIARVLSPKDVISAYGFDPNDEDVGDR